jgi:ABC-type uncharacterized transport system substrate-binding protein
VAVHCELVITLAARYRLPAVYSYRYFVTEGGLTSYGPDPIDQYRRAACYVDRILRGDKPADLPVQAPTKYELAINLKTAKALGLDSTHFAPIVGSSRRAFNDWAGSQAAMNSRLLTRSTRPRGREALAGYRILKGAKPSDLPVLQPAKFELTVNLKTAKALGLTIPSSTWCKPTR